MIGRSRGAGAQRIVFLQAPPGALSHPFFGWEGSPTKSYRKKESGTNLVQPLKSEKNLALSASIGIGVVSFWSGFSPLGSTFQMR